MMLRKLGFYAELEYGDPSGGSITERRPLDPVDKRQVLHYLRTAPVIASSPGPFTDYFTGETIAAQEFHTDGEWVWFADFPYYVDRYDTVVDSKFLLTVDFRAEVTLTADRLETVTNSLGQLS
jgi:hypothetical protein